MPVTANAIISLLKLTPHPEGGFFRETFRAEKRAEPGERSASTAIYFLLRPGELSALHRVASDEVWHHYLGCAAELHLLERANHAMIRLGPSLEHGERPQAVVNAGILQATRVPSQIGRGDFDFALFGCTVAPGFEFSDFEMPGRDALLRDFPEHRELVRELTRA
jgi:predicted cupin superfamily sugar epimerase